jgi:hypothetical protein
MEEYDSEQFRMKVIYDFMKDFFAKDQLQVLILIFTALISADEGCYTIEN